MIDGESCPRLHHRRSAVIDQLAWLEVADSVAAAAGLRDVLAAVVDPRDRRGVRHGQVTALTVVMLRGRGRGTVVRRDHRVGTRSAGSCSRVDGDGLDVVISTWSHDR
jgi:hypothetical protein